MRLFIDNQLITGRVEGLKNLSVTYNRKGEGGEPSVSFSNELQIYDDGYNLIKAQLIDAPSGRLNTLDVKIFDDCCEGAIFEGKITGTTIEWCEDECYITTQVIQNDSTAKQLQCLRSTLVTDDSIRDSRGRSFTQRNYPAFSYCNEVRPQFVHDLLIVIGLIQEVVFFLTVGLNFSVVFLVLQIVAFLVNTFGDLFGIEMPDFTKYIEGFKKLRQLMRALIVGCGRSHPTPMVRDYIDNVCKACGLQFESSILNDVNSPYYTLAYLNAPIKKGNNPLNLKIILGDLTPNTLIEENLPFVSGIDFLEQMKTVFNADYKIKNDTLVFETVTDIEAEIWKSSSDLSITDGICYTWSGDEKEPASGKFSYAQDGVDVVGDEALGRYNDIVSWQGFANQEGIEETNLLFGAARFRDDGIDRDVVSYWNRVIDNVGLIGDFFALAKDFNFSLLMEKGRTTFPKLILWDSDGTSFNNAKAIRVGVTGFQDYRGNGVFPVQNYPMFFDSEKSGNLYDRFHYLNDPRTSVQRNKNYEFTATIDCNDISDFDITKNIGLPDNFVGTMETVTINYSNRTITINGKV